MNETPEWEAELARMIERKAVIVRLTPSGISSCIVRPDLLPSDSRISLGAYARSPR